MALNYRAIPNPVVFGPLSYDQLILADSPVGYWPLSEASGTNANDASTTNNDGTYTNTPTLGETGPVTDSATAVTFNGTTQYVTAANVAAQDTNSAMSIEAWFKATASGSFDTIASRGVLNTNGWHAYVNSGATRVQVFFTGLSTTIAAAPVGLNDGNWHHFVGTYDGARLKAYLDGVKGYDWASTGTITTTTEPLQIGRIGGGAGQDYFPGSLAKVALYNYALTQAKIDARWARRVV